MLELAHAAATLFMTGVVWYVQLVHYPLFPRAKGDPGYFRENLVRTSVLAGPVMLAELACAVLLCVRRGDGASWLGLALLALAWAFTGLQQFPGHLALSRGWDERVHRAAILRGNWARVVLWTARAALALSFMRARDL